MLICQGTIGQLTCRILSLPKFMELHSRMFHNKFFFSNRKLWPIQNHTIYIHHETWQYFKVWDHDVQYHFHEDTVSQMPFILLSEQPIFHLMYCSFSNAKIMCLLTYIKGGYKHFMHHQSSHEEIECWDGCKIVEAWLIKWTDQSSNAILLHFWEFFSMHRLT